MSLWQTIIATPQLFSVLISLLALFVSWISTILSLRADRLARESVRPYVSTGVHIASDNMGVSLSNYGVGVAIITKVAISRGEIHARNSLVPLLPASESFDIRAGVSFVQDLYFLRPGDTLPLASAEVVDKDDPADALQDWANALDGVKVAVEYSDILSKRFEYARVISIKRLG